MNLHFSKMHGLGNDFVVIDAIRQKVDLSVPQLRLLADRHFGVGCDQILMVETATRPDADFRYRIFNADGGEVEQCGNGARCFMRFVHETGLSAKREIRVETLCGIITPRLEDDGRVSVDMGQPDFVPQHVPFLSDSLSDSDALTQPLQVGAESREITPVSMGNPHAVQLVDDIERAPVAVEGALIESHPRFPQRVNAGFVQLLGPDHIALRVFERGVGETLACGSGACAAAAAVIARGLARSPLTVTMRGGALTIAWNGAGTPVRMTGPAVTVFTGEIEL